jgi:hypothetical protein
MITYITRKYVIYLLTNFDRKITRTLWTSLIYCSDNSQKQKMHLFIKPFQENSSSNFQKLKTGLSCFYLTVHQVSFQIPQRFILCWLVHWEWKRPLGRLWCSWEDGIKMDLRETGWWGVEWIDLAQDRHCWQAVMNVVMNLQVLLPQLVS